jgi:hypothetical protein
MLHLGTIPLDTSSIKNVAVMDGLRLGPVQEVSEICAALATLVAATMDSDDDTKSDDGALSPSATAVVASGAISVGLCSLIVSKPTVVESAYVIGVRN